MAEKRNSFPGQSTISKTNPLPIVITGTMPRDDATLELVRFLNRESQSGRIEVFYFPNTDLSEPLKTRIAKDQIREVHPVRVPEDLIVSERIQNDDVNDFYASVREHLHTSGKLAFGICYPSITPEIVEPVSCRVQFNWDDQRYYHFSQGDLIEANIPYVEPMNLINIEKSLATIGLANLGEVQILKGAKYENPKIAKSDFRSEVEKKLFKLRGSGTSEEYIDAVIDHLLKNLPDVVEATTSDEPLKESGIRNDLHKYTSDLAKTAISSIEEIIGRDPEIEQAELTADEILAKAEREAAELIEKARAQSDDIVEKASEKSDELMDAAIEAGALVTELPEMLAGPVSMMIGQHLEKQERRAQSERDELARKRVAVKEYCDVLSAASVVFENTDLTEWGFQWGTRKFKTEYKEFSTALYEAFSKNIQRVEDRDRIQDMVNETNLGISTMKPEDAICAVGIFTSIEKLKSTATFEKLTEWEDESLNKSLATQWTLDREQVDRALFHSLIEHSRVNGISDADKKFISTCDHVLGGAISDSLARSLHAHLMDGVYAELQSADPNAVRNDTDSLLVEVESIAKSSQIEHNGGQLAQTLHEIGEAARAHEIAPTTAALEPMLMRSDGTLVSARTTSPISTGR